MTPEGWAALGGILVGVAALVGVFRVKRSAKTVTTEIVDKGVLAQFNKLHERIGALEILVAQQKISLDAAHKDLREMRQLEEWLQAQVHDRDKQLEIARNRIRTLEGLLADRR